MRSTNAAVSFSAVSKRLWRRGVMGMRMTKGLQRCFTALKHGGQFIQLRTEDLETVEYGLHG
jgi:hypothetical protein